jgi:DNA-binding transcriptional LysR family regulator
VECVLIPPLVKKLAVEAPNVHIDITILREEIPELALADGEIDFLLGFDEYMKIPGYLCRETWLNEPLTGILRAGHPFLQRPADPGRPDCLAACLPRAAGQSGLADG